MIRLVIEGEIEDLQELFKVEDVGKLSEAEKEHYKEHMEQEIDFKEMIDYISEQTDIDKTIVEEVLESEEDYLYWKGLIEY